MQIHVPLLRLVQLDDFSNGHVLNHSLSVTQQHWGHMGAHESNKGLCKALMRAFLTLQCEQMNAGNVVAQDVTTKCTAILQRMRERACEMPDMREGEVVAKT